MHHDDGWFATALMGVAEFDASPAHQRWGVSCHGIVEDGGQERGGQGARCGSPGGIHGAEQGCDAEAGACRDGVCGDEVDEGEFAFQRSVDSFAGIPGDGVPFVYADDQGPTGVDDEPDEMEVLIGDAFLGIDEQDGDVGGLDGLQRFDDAEFFYFFGDSCPAPDARRVDEYIGFFTADQGNSNAVARGAGVVMNDDAGFPQQVVDQGGFADVGATDDGDPGAPLLFVGIAALGQVRFGRGRRMFFGWGEETGGNVGHHGGDSPPVRGGDGPGVAKTQGMEIGGGGTLIETIDFIGYHYDGCPERTEKAGYFLVGGREPLAGIDQEQSDVGLAESGQGLSYRKPREIEWVIGESSRIYYQIRRMAYLARPILAIAGQARFVGDQCVTGTGQTIEESGLPNVGASDDGNDGEHFLVRVVRTC